MYYNRTEYDPAGTEKLESSENKCEAEKKQRSEKAAKTATSQ